jgi:glutathione synthase/RimK-type ligase-like ATP-grasp enzyme
VDLRVTIVGEDVFAAEIHSQTTEYKHDFRMAMHDAAIRSHTLPDAVVAKLQALMAALGLVYGALDLRLTPEGDYVFLEINPAGQWLFIEHHTGQPISDAIADALVARAGR